MADGFDDFWKLYPRKIAKGDARKAWLQTEKIRPELPVMLKAVRVARASEQWLKDGGQFIPYPATWLRQERWEDVHTVDLQKLDGPSGRVCAYCAKSSTGSVNGIWHCDLHGHDAMDGKATNVMMLKAVA